MGPRKSSGAKCGVVGGGVRSPGELQTNREKEKQKRRKGRKIKQVTIQTEQQIGVTARIKKKTESRAHLRGAISKNNPEEPGPKKYSLTE